jgi:uncharacterized protein (TIGR00251 family)
MMNLKIIQGSSGVTFAVKVVPGSSRNAIAGILGDALKVNISAPPEKGKANQQLLKLLAKTMDKPKSDVTIRTGSHQPRKEIPVAGITRSQLLEKVRPYLKV